MENTLQGTPYQENLLDEVDYTLVPASSGKRLANYLIDLFVFYIAWKVFFRYIGLKIAMSMIGEDEGKASIYLKVLLIAVVFEVTLMSAIEFVGGGRSLGKLLTRTRAVNDDGTPITFKTAVLRRLSRMVPFEAFSALGAQAEPWHDRWTNTRVIEERDSTLPPPL
jgi:uncharacterized RDD family membrane protein YckC